MILIKNFKCWWVPSYIMILMTNSNNTMILIIDCKWQSKRNHKIVHGFRLILSHIIMLLMNQNWYHDIDNGNQMIVNLKWNHVINCEFEVIVNFKQNQNDDWFQVISWYRCQVIPSDVKVDCKWYHDIENWFQVKKSKFILWYWLWILDDSQFQVISWYWCYTRSKVIRWF